MSINFFPHLSIPIDCSLEISYQEDVYRKDYDNLVAGLDFLEEFVVFVGPYIGQPHFDALTQAILSILEDNGSNFYRHSRGLRPQHSNPSMKVIATTKRYSEYAHHYHVKQDQEFSCC